MQYSQDTRKALDDLRKIKRKIREAESNSVIFWDPWDPFNIYRSYYWPFVAKTAKIEYLLAGREFLILKRRDRFLYNQNKKRESLNSRIANSLLYNPLSKPNIGVGIFYSVLGLNMLCLGAIGLEYLVQDQSNFQDIKNYVKIFSYVSLLYGLTFTCIGSLSIYKSYKR